MWTNVQCVNKYYTYFINTRHILPSKFDYQERFFNYHLNTTDQVSYMIVHLL
jgi:hypothetical protein